MHVQIFTITTRWYDITQAKNFGGKIGELNVICYILPNYPD